ncbi:hypothetical protein BCEP4_650008 [Burkholderia cepacia]|nr:hypothetical protein BCEP4_650008 [Burkholderia cepacia]
MEAFILPFPKARAVRPWQWMSLPDGESVAVSMSGALNVSVCDRKKHPVWLKLPFADLETIHAYFLGKPKTKTPRT